MQSRAVFTTCLLLSLPSCAPSEVPVHGLALAEHLSQWERNEPEARPSPPDEITLFENPRGEAPRTRAWEPKHLATPPTLQCPHPERPSPEHSSYCLVELDAASYQYKQLKQYDASGRLVLDHDTMGKRIEISYDGPHYSERKRIWKWIAHENRDILESEFFILRDSSGRLLTEEHHEHPHPYRNTISPAVVIQNLAYDAEGNISMASLSTHTPPPCDGWPVICGIDNTIFFMDREQRDGSIVRMASFDKNRNGLADDGDWKDASKYSSFTNTSKITRSKTTIDVCQDRPRRLLYASYTFEYDAQGLITHVDRYDNGTHVLTATIERRCDGFTLHALHARGERKPLATIRYTGGACHRDAPTIEQALDQFFVRTLL